ncbi:MAG: XdhC family protein, partial [Opitutales bacterium]
AVETGWHVTVADPRAARATAARFPNAHRVVVAESAAAGSLVAGPDTSVVIMTHRFLEDAVLLRALLPLPLPYLGLLGPRARLARLLGHLQRDGFTPTEEMRTRLHSPVGLDLGGSTPEAVALSILAELQSHRHRRPALPLRDRPGPIHE